MSEDKYIMYVRGMSREVAAKLDFEAKRRGMNRAKFIQYLYEVYPDKLFEERKEK